MSDLTAQPNPEFRMTDHCGATRSLVTMFAYSAGPILRWVKNAPPEIEDEAFMAAVRQSLIEGVSRRTFDSAVERVLDTGEPFFGETAVIVNGQPRRFEISLNPHDDGEILGVATDLSGRAPDERTIRALSLELAHRTKNLMAVVASVAAQTARRCDTLEEFTPNFMGQISALASAHDSIAATGWTGASLDTIVHAQHDDDDPAMSVRLQGDAASITLTPNAAQNIAMVLHELKSACPVDAVLTVGKANETDLSIHCTCTNIDPAWKLWTDLLTKIAPLALGGTAELSEKAGELTYTLVMSDSNFATT